MTSIKETHSRPSKLKKPEFWILAIGIAIAVFGSSSMRYFIKSAFFYLNPRYYPDWTRYLLALVLIWTILDLGARAAFLTLRRRKEAQANAESDVAAIVPRERRTAPTLERKWNGVSALLLLATALTLNAAFNWDYHSVTRATLLEDARAVPTLKDYASRGAFAGGANRVEPRFLTLGYVCVAVLAFLSFAYLSRWRRGQRFIRSFSDRAARVVLSRSYVAYATALVLWDVGVYFVSFLSWALYRYYYLPITNFMYSYKIGWEQLRALALVALAFTSLLAVASIWRNRDERVDVKTR